MRIELKSLICALGLLVFAAPVLAASPNAFKVSAQLSHNGNAIAAPVAVVKASKPANIEMTGSEGYKLTFLVTELAPDKLQVAASVVSEHGSMEPTLVVRPDQPAKVSVGDLVLELTVSRSDG